MDRRNPDTARNGPKATLLSPSVVGDVNRARILGVLRDLGPLSRADLARHARVTRATIGAIVGSLVDDGVLEEGEAVYHGTVGKPAKPVWFAPGAGASAAVSLRRGSADLAIIDARGECLARERVALPDETDGATAATIVADGLDRITAGVDARWSGAGVAVPGLVARDGKVLGSGQLPHIAGRDIIRTLSARLDGDVLISNDVQAQAMGERWFGQGRGLDRFAAVQAGDGIGAGVVIDGVLALGPGGLALEAGHTCVDIGHEAAYCRCGLRGCWEAVASTRWLAKAADSVGLEHIASPADLAREAVNAAGGGGRAALLLDEYAGRLAVGLATIVQLFGPEMIILHGAVVDAGEPLRSRIAAALDDRVFPVVRGTVPVVFSTLDDDATLLGAAGLVLSAAFAT
jgi:predicted NBD/HSP70 family sugar kinase